MYLLIGVEELVHRHNFGQDDTNSQQRPSAMAAKDRHGEPDHEVATASNNIN
jgi:hypothetical protein